jgi:hypothetical protein
LHHRCPANRLIMRRRWREPAAIAAEIDRIRSLRLDALRRQWRLVFGRVPPAGLSKDLLGRMMAARLQERAFGGLDRDSVRFLESLARHGRPPRRQLKPGRLRVPEGRSLAWRADADCVERVSDPKEMAPGLPARGAVPPPELLGGGI